MDKIFSHRRFWSIFWGVASVMCMAVIFFMSHKPAMESAEMSGVITEWLIEHGVSENNAENTETVVRKSAHMFEFFSLCFCMGMFVHVRKGRLSVKYIAAVLAICVLYAASDEIHQLFIDGRAGQVRDVLIDTSGAALAMLLLIVVEKVSEKLKKRVYCKG